MKNYVIIAASIVLCCSAYADERQERDEIAANAAELFRGRDFHALEEVAESYRAGSERTPAGMWKIRRFYGGIENTMPGEDPDHPDWRTALDATDEWSRLYPDSPTPHVVRAHLLMHHGWTYRGSGYAHTVDPLDMKRLKQLAEESRENLLQHKQVASHDPEFYSVLAKTDLALGTPEEEFRLNLDEGLQRYSDYDELYFRASEYYSPKWYGSESALASFAAESVERTKEQRGFELYARIYWAVGRAPDGRHYFSRRPADWTLMRSGIFDLVEQYPDQWNINHLAFFACMQRDHGLAAKLIEKIEEPILESAWYRRSNLEMCKRKILEQR